MMTIEEARAFFAEDRFALEVCGIAITEVTEDSARCEMPLSPRHLNANHVAQGGAVFTLCDFCMAVAANAQGVMTVSQSCDIHFLRPGTGDKLLAEARVLNQSRSTCLVEVRVTDTLGKLVALMTGSGFRKDAASAKR